MSVPRRGLNWLCSWIRSTRSLPNRARLASTERATPALMSARSSGISRALVPMMAVSLSCRSAAPRLISDCPLPYMDAVSK